MFTVSAFETTENNPLGNHMRFSQASDYLRRQKTERHGSMLVLIVFCLIILFAVAAFSIDIAYMHLTRAELRTATDAAARAGVEALGRLQNENDAQNAAIAFAAQNNVAGAPLLLDQADVVMGSNQFVNGKFEFVPGGFPVNSIQVNGRRTADSRSGSIPLFFGQFTGQPDFQPVQTATAARVDIDIALVLDISGSMGSNNRFTGLKNAVNVFANELNATPQDEVVSMSVYSSSARKVVEMTPSMSAITTRLNDFRPGGTTAIGRGMQAGLTSFNDPNARPFALRAMIVMTDGNQNRGINPINVVPACNAENVRVHTITFSSGANQSLMRNVAQAGNGIHLHANNNAQLEQAFRDIARQLSVMLIE